MAKYQVYVKQAGKVAIPCKGVGRDVSKSGIFETPETRNNFYLQNLQQEKW